MMENMTLEAAEAKLIASLSNLVWILRSERLTQIGLVKIIRNNYYKQFKGNVVNFDNGFVGSCYIQGHQCRGTTT